MPGSSHSCCGNVCDHIHESSEFEALSLLSSIDVNNISCLNEKINESGKTVFKPHNDRDSIDKFVESDADVELLFNIPFTGIVKLTGITIASTEDGSHPKEVFLYKDRENMSFDSIPDKSDKDLQLAQTCEYPMFKLEQTRFSSIKHLSIYVKGNYGAESTRIHYIGLFGSFLSPFRNPVVITNYEVTPNITDHKHIIDQTNSSFIS
ncbi:PITH domain-containing protein 1 [Cichlidogyrus casuarinus]|uniref:PITH domain-containing protein 1 n=1 Tax=Cichlidogyrus casuarinus TaxID=1844966 RepID=A0ABD2Q7B6_9PLAT